MVGNLEQELKNERKCIKEELARNKKMKKRTRRGSRFSAGAATRARKSS